MNFFPYSIHLLLATVVWSLNLSAVHAQQPPAAKANGELFSEPALPQHSELSPIPPRPESHLLDESGMLPEEMAKALSEKLLSSQARTGLGIYVAIHTYLSDETAEIRASRTYDAWIGMEGAGIVVVHDRSTGRISFAGSDDKRLPDGESLRGLYRLADASAKSLPARATIPDRLIATINGLAEGLESWQINGRLPAPPPLPASSTSPAPPVDSATSAMVRPEGMLLDEARVFSGAAAAALRDQLSLWRKQYGLQIYVVTITYPPVGTGLILSDKLALEWLPVEPGGVIVFDRSQTDSLTVATSPFLNQWIPPAQLKDLQKNLTALGSAAGKDPQDRIAAVAAGLMKAYVPDGLPIWREGHQLLPAGRSRILFLVLIGLMLFGAIFYFLKRWQENADRRRRTNFLFPEVYVPIRLGAPHGGGVSVESPPITTPLPNGSSPRS